MEPVHEALSPFPPLYYADTPQPGVCNATPADAAAAAIASTPDEASKSTSGLIGIPLATVPSGQGQSHNEVDNLGHRDDNHHENGIKGPETNDENTTKAVARRPRTSVASITPPFWQPRHSRSTSAASAASTTSAGGGSGMEIRLEDHTESPTEYSRGLWAKSVSIEDYTVVRGMTGLGAYVVWRCEIRTLDEADITVRMRYSDFVELRAQLEQTFPQSSKSLPPLPPKNPFFNFQPRFLEKRRAGLEYFFNCILLNPEFSGSPVLKEFIFMNS